MPSSRKQTRTLCADCRQLPLTFARAPAGPGHSAFRPSTLLWLIELAQGGLDRAQEQGRSDPANAGAWAEIADTHAEAIREYKGYL